MAQTPISTSLATAGTSHRPHSVVTKERLSLLKIHSPCQSPSKNYIIYPLKKLHNIYTPATTAKRPDEKQTASRECNFEKDFTPQWHPVLSQYKRHYYTSPVGCDSDSKVLVWRKATHLWCGAVPPWVTIVTSHLHLTWPAPSAAAVRHVVVLVRIVPER